MGGIGAALLGKLVDLTSLNFVYHLCSFLPAIGILTALLPNLDPAKLKTTAPQASAPTYVAPPAAEGTTPSNKRDL